MTSRRGRVVAFTLCAAVIGVASATASQAQPQRRSGYLVAGVVVDNVGGLPGAEVRLVELGRLAVTDEQGRFRFMSVPAGRVTLGVHLQGFGSLHRTIVVEGDSELRLTLDPDLRFAEEVVVSAAPWTLKPLETAQQTDQVPAVEVRQARVASVGEALSRVPGVAFIPTGNALGTPVIRGISEHRIRVLNDGLALNHQQFSWRHAPNVEPGFAERIELVRGPASVLYGPDAMGGVVNLIHRPLPHAPHGGRVFHGELSPGVSTNAREWSGQGRLEGAFGGFGWRADALRREGGDIRTPRGSLSNTDFDQTNATAMAGYGGAWGTIRARWHHWENDTGFHRPVGFRLGLQDDLAAADLHLATRAGVVEVLAGRQQNRRRAFELPGRSATLDLDQSTLTARVSLQHRDVRFLRGQVAVEHQRVDNRTRTGTLVPDYETATTAVMLFEEARLRTDATHGWPGVIVSAGLRGDLHDLAMTRADPRSKSSYGAVTGALGVVYRVHEAVALAGSVGRGWRPPTPFELRALGVHGGVSAFQEGNPDLQEESNVNAETSIRFEGRRLRGSLAAYRNAFDNYIYLADSGRTQGGLPVFVYRQADATLTGVEATLHVSPRPWMEMGLSATWLDTRNEQTGRLLPQTPADRLLVMVQLQRPRVGVLRSARVGLDCTWVGEGRVSGGDEPLGTPTRAYEVFDLQAGATIPLGRTHLDVAIAVRNLLDREYRDFLWSYKPFAPNPGRDLRLTTAWRF
jgi:iron complex outermembrane receptor protein/hemoglobin/transferrin/lactoferrin receptor protein